MLFDLPGDESESEISFGLIRLADPSYEHYLDIPILKKSPILQTPQQLPSLSFSRGVLVV